MDLRGWMNQEIKCHRKNVRKSKQKNMSIVNKYTYIANTNDILRKLRYIFIKSQKDAYYQ